MRAFKLAKKGLSRLDKFQYEQAVEKLSPISGEMARLMKEQDEIDKILAKGAEQARAITAPILKKTYEIIGMVGS